MNFSNRFKIGILVLSIGIFFEEGKVKVSKDWYKIVIFEFMINV